MIHLVLTKVNPSFIEDVDRYYSDTRILDSFLGKEPIKEALVFCQKEGYVRKEIDAELLSDTLVRLLKSYFYNPLFFKVDNPPFHFFRNVFGPCLVGALTPESLETVKEVNALKAKENPEKYIDTGILL